MSDSRQLEILKLCDDIISTLNKALASLDKASVWGLIDIFGGKMISTFMKHSNMSTTRNILSQAEFQINTLYNKLDDNERMIVIGDTDIHWMLSLADFVCDGILPDLFVQKRISDIRKKIYSVIDEVTEIKIKALSCL